MANPMRIDDLAHRSGVPSTTIRLYQNRGLLPGPRLEGRTGWYDESHVARLHLIARLQDDGFSLAGIGKLLTARDSGGGLTDLLGDDQPLAPLLTRRKEVVLSPEELAEHLPADAVVPELLAKAVDVGLVAFTDDGRIRVLDRRYLEIGPALTELGLPPEVILDEWAALSTLTDQMADRFLTVFETRLLPDGWQVELDDDHAVELATTLARLSTLAGEVVQTALEASLLAAARRRVGDLVPAH